MGGCEGRRSLSRQLCAGSFDHSAKGMPTPPGRRSWRIYEVPCGHDVMLDMPEQLAAILQETL